MILFFKNILFKIKTYVSPLPWLNVRCIKKNKLRYMYIFEHTFLTSRVAVEGLGLEAKSNKTHTL